MQETHWEGEKCSIFNWQHKLYCMIYLWGACSLKQSKIIFSASCENNSKETACCEVELMLLTVWKENYRSANSHLIAGEKPGHSCSYPQVSWAFPSTLLAQKPLWQSSKKQVWPQSLAESFGNHIASVWYITVQPHNSQQHGDSSPFGNGSVTHLNQDKSGLNRIEENESEEPTATCYKNKYES